MLQDSDSNSNIEQIKPAASPSSPALIQASARCDKVGVGIKEEKDKWDVGHMIKERNESCSLEKVAFVVAGLKGVGVDEVAEHAWRNSTSMFFTTGIDNLLV